MKIHFVDGPMHSTTMVGEQEDQSTIYLPLPQMMTEQMFRSMVPDMTQVVAEYNLLSKTRAGTLIYQFKGYLS